MIIDAHQHVWDLDRAHYGWLGPELAPINQTMSEQAVLPQLRRAGVDGVVLVQAADNAEDTAFMLEVSGQFPQVVGVVGYVPLDDPARVRTDLVALGTDPLVVGVRNLIHDLPDPDFLLRRDVNEGLALVAGAGLSFDVVSALPRHLEHVSVLARRHPDLRIVIDHLSRPPIGAADMEPWWTLIERAAAEPNVTAKVSGLYRDENRAAWTTELIRPVFERALEVFGPQRLMYGGDWPISVLAGGYDRVWEGLQPLFAQLSEPDRADILGGTARRVYRLPPDRLAAAAAWRNDT
jgi:L-fuconolactonase